ncbi:MAG: hypothetical protein M1814_005913 [Vezdaea aestivalis]|nr:MAG: hypothetical protein M1814_005913 [Vezdaea aestivalis]
MFVVLSTGKGSYEGNMQRRIYGMGHTAEPLRRMLTCGTVRHTERSTLAADTSTPHTLLSKINACLVMVADDVIKGLRGSAFNGYKRNADSETLHLNSLITARAYENTCAVVFVNAGGPTKEMIGTDLVNEHTEEQYGGVSQVAVPFVGPVERIDGPEEGWKTAEVDMEILEEAEMDYRIRKDLKTEGWHYVLQDGGGKDKAKVRVGE